MLVNLIGNAIKFTDTGRIDISVEPKSEDELLFSVMDTGIGIPLDKQQAIFEPFIQAGAEHVTRRHAGTGLGLTVCKKIVEQMGGSIWFKSRPKQGSTFFFTARLPDVESLDKGAINYDQPLWNRRGLVTRDRRRQERRSSGTILVVDDSDDNRLLIRAFLKNTSLRLVEAGDGAQAVERFKSGHFDLVLMDLQLPRKDGYSATREIRQWETQYKLPPTPIIAVTAFAMSEDAQKALDAGCDFHLPKPVKKALLLDVIDQYMNRMDTIL